MSFHRIFHVTAPDVWCAAKDAGSFTESTRARSLEQVGYIHCSFAEQVARVANAIYQDYQGDLLLLTIDPTRVVSAIRVENLEGGEEVFPHIYGALPLDAVTAVQSMVRQNGRWALPTDL